MAINSIDEALKQASETNKSQSNSTSKAQENTTISNDRISDTQIGYYDGTRASFDYVEGFRRGFHDGISKGRESVLNDFRQSLAQGYRQPLTIDLSSICDNLPKIESKPIFQLPPVPLM